VTLSRLRTFYFLYTFTFSFLKPQHAAGENSKQNKVLKAFEEASAFGILVGRYLRNQITTDNDEHSNLALPAMDGRRKTKY
jgi:hypothetical protein